MYRECGLIGIRGWCFKNFSVGVPIDFDNVRARAGCAWSSWGTGIGWG